MKKFCVYCGQELDEKCKFCHNCGAESKMINTTEKTSNSSVTVNNNVVNNSNDVKYSNKLALIGLILSIVSLTMCCGILSLPSFIVSCIGLKDAYDHNKEGKGMAIAGILISVLPLILIILNIILNFISMPIEATTELDYTDIMNELFSL